MYLFYCFVSPLLQTHFMIVCFLQRITILFLKLFLFWNTTQASAYLPFFSHHHMYIYCDRHFSGAPPSGAAVFSGHGRGLYDVQRNNVRPRPLCTEQISALFRNCDSNESPTRPMNAPLPHPARRTTLRCSIMYKVQRKRLIRFLY